MTAGAAGAAGAAGIPAAADPEAARRDVDRMLRRLVEPALAELADRLRSETSLGAAERDAVRAGLTGTLRRVLWRYVSRAVLVELQAARLTGQLTAADSRARWQEWVDRLSRPGAWDAVAEPYPALLPRVRAMVANRCTAALALARRFDADRARLPALLPGGGPGALTGVEFGAGDSHAGGQTVAILDCAAGRLVYKPRSAAVDSALGELVPRLLLDWPANRRIRVPEVLCRHDQQGEYGWAAYVPHRYCAGDDELRSYYQGLGHWLAVMRLLSGSDLHSENVVAAGPVPVVVDCETLFTPHHAAKASGYGAAVDLAVERIGRSVLRTGLLPGRGAVLGFRGVDPSAAGYLPDQQPVFRVPTIVGFGTDQAWVGLAEAPPAPRANLPSPDPDLSRYWEQVVDGFAELTDELHRRDRAGELAPLLARFADCPVRVLLRDTASYAELGRMLWHPGSLHSPEPAIRRARELLARQARNRPGAPSDPAVIEAEVADLLDGDVPAFVTTPASGVLAGPRGTRCGAAEDLVESTLQRWRATEPWADRQIVAATLVGAYLNDGRMPGDRRMSASLVRTGDLDRRRRVQAAGVLRQLAGAAVWGGDGSVTWVAPILDGNGWSVRPLPPDLYNGGIGVAILLAGYLREQAAGRADPVPAVPELLTAVVRTLRRFEEQTVADRADATRAGLQVRPEPVGGYLGLSSRIWGWLRLSELGAVAASEAHRWAQALAGQLPEAVAADDRLDLLAGAAGAVVPLLRLAERTGNSGWSALATEIGERLRTAAELTGAGAGWSTGMFPDRVGGFAHGATGFGWALARLAAATDAAPLHALAEEAFRWEESLFSPELGGWRDLRSAGEIVATGWCHGSVGIGLCAADLLARTGQDRWREQLRRAAALTWRTGLGTNHTLCHGDLGAWELLDRAYAAGVGPAGLTPGALLARILSNLEEYGPVTGMTRDMLSPGLVPGVGGIAYQLLRMHPQCPLPSVLLPDPGPAPTGDAVPVSGP